jgi:hypothetical protein
MLGEPGLAILTRVCHWKKVRQRGWAYVQARLACTMAAVNGLVQWHGCQLNASSCVPLSLTALSV